jgi:hypothetical protein
MATRTQPVVDPIYTFDKVREALKKHGNRCAFRQHSNPGGCVIRAIPNLVMRYVIEIAGLSKGQ